MWAAIDSGGKGLLVLTSAPACNFEYMICGLEETKKLFKTWCNSCSPSNLFCPIGKKSFGVCSSSKETSYCTSINASKHSNEEPTMDAINGVWKLAEGLLHWGKGNKHIRTLKQREKINQRSMQAIIRKQKVNNGGTLSLYSTYKIKLNVQIDSMNMGCLNSPSEEPVQLSWI